MSIKLESDAASFAVFFLVCGPVYSVALSVGVAGVLG